MKLNKKIIPAKITKNMSAGELVTSFQSCAFGAGRLYEAVDICRMTLNAQNSSDLRVLWCLQE
jgi:deoxyhypusine synthase